MNPSDKNGVELTHPWKHLKKVTGKRSYKYWRYSLMFAWGPLEVPVADDPPRQIFIKAHFFKAQEENG